jgi:hypothetical protein
MNYHHKGFAGLMVLWVVLGLFVLGGAGYVALNPDVIKTSTTVEEDAQVQTAPGDHPEVDHDANDGVSATASGKIGIHWKFDTKAEVNNIPQTMVSVQVGEKVYEVGTFQGSCSEIGASGGVDGKGLLAGEVAGAQCWFAGGGDEIGVFAHEDGGYQIMTGSISEPDGEGATGFRGDFHIKTDIRL